MHPNPAFRRKERMLQEALVDDIGFATIFAATPDGPRVAHAPVLSTGDGAIQFHLARSNALTRHIEGQRVLATVTGPDAYISARWYESADQVPTWNYVAVEMEGRVRRMHEEGLLALLESLSAQHEGRITSGGEPWTMDKMSDKAIKALLRGIVGFELEIAEWRETIKLSQNKPDRERDIIIAALQAEGHASIAQLMRSHG